MPTCPASTPTDCDHAVRYALSRFLDFGLRCLVLYLAPWAAVPEVRGARPPGASMRRLFCMMPDSVRRLPCMPPQPADCPRDLHLASSLAVPYDAVSGPV